MQSQVFLSPTRVIKEWNINFYRPRRTLYLYLCSHFFFGHTLNLSSPPFGKPLNSQSSWVVTSSPSETGTWTKHNEWTVEELQCGNERGMSEEREASPDVLSQRIFSRPDQPPLQARRSHRNAHAHTYTHILKLNKIHEAHWAVCKTRARTISECVATRLELWASWGPHMSPQSIIPHSLPLLTRSQSSAHLPSLCRIHFSMKGAVSSN